MEFAISKQNPALICRVLLILCLPRLASFSIVVIEFRICLVDWLNNKQTAFLLSILSLF